MKTNLKLLITAFIATTIIITLKTNDISFMLAGFCIGWGVSDMINRIFERYFS